MAAITSGEIVFQYITTSGAAGDTTADDTTAGAAATSLGKHASTTAWAGGSANDLFDDITGGGERRLPGQLPGHRGAEEQHRQQAPDSGRRHLRGDGGRGVDRRRGGLHRGVREGWRVRADADHRQRRDRACGCVVLLADDRHWATMSNLPVAQVKGIWVRRSAANTSAASDGVNIAVTGDTGAL